MSDDRIIEFMALMGDYMRNTDRRFEQLITVMHDGFGRLSDQISTLTNEVRDTNRRVDVLTEEVREIKTDVKVLKEEMGEVKTEAQATNRRLNATFDYAGHLTEQVDATELRISHVEKAQVPTNAELHQRVLALENKLNQAS